MLFQEKPIFSLRIYSFSFISTDKGRKKYDIMPMLPRTFAYAFAYFRPYGTTPSPSFVRTYTATAAHLYQPQPTPVHQLMRASTATVAHLRPPITIPTPTLMRTCVATAAHLCLTMFIGVNRSLSEPIVSNPITFGCLYVGAQPFIRRCSAGCT